MKSDPDDEHDSLAEAIIHGSHYERLSAKGFRLTRSSLSKRIYVQAFLFFLITGVCLSYRLLPAEITNITSQKTLQTPTLTIILSGILFFGIVGLIGHTAAFLVKLKSKDFIDEAKAREIICLEDVSSYAGIGIAGFGTVVTTITILLGFHGGKAMTVIFRKNPFDAVNGHGIPLSLTLVISFSLAILSILIASIIKYETTIKNLASPS